jgi:cell division protein FtsA
MLNGGIILTGGGSQLKHLIQLTEYVTGLNARIGFPNEHLSSGHIDELAKPMYSTCIGLILKGYNVYENSQNKFRTVEVPEPVISPEPVFGIVDEEPKFIPVKTNSRKNLKGFLDSFKTGLIDLFKEEEDRKFN